MTDILLFNLFRRMKRRWTKEGMAALSQPEVDEINAVLDDWKRGATTPPAAPSAPSAPPAVSTGLRDPAAFFAALRGSLGPLDQSQVDGFNRLLAKMGAARWPISWVAYGLATAWHETANKMQPVREGLGASDAWRRRNLRYYPWYGRGDVQLTWESNYELADEELGLGGELVKNPDKALDPEISANVIVWGMDGGKYTGKALSDYLPRDGLADRLQFKSARYIVNGQDRADKIAGEALAIQAALKAGGWA